MAFLYLIADEMGIYTYQNYCLDEVVNHNLLTFVFCSCILLFEFTISYSEFSTSCMDITGVLRFVFSILNSEFCTAKRGIFI